MSGPANAVTDTETGSRWYVHPITGERFISVTTVLGSIAKYGLPSWSANLTAEAALDRAEWLHGVADYGIDSCNAKGDDACGECKACALVWLADRHNVERDKAASIGTRLHDAADKHTLFGPGGTVDDEVQPFLDGYMRWVAAWKPEFVASEMTVISRKWGYAGTLDWIARFEQANLPAKFKHLAGLNLVGDTKTGKHMDIPKGWQVTAYSKADAVLLPDGTEQPMPEIGGGLLLHLRPTVVQVREVHVTEPNFAHFRHTLRVAEGLSAGLNTVLSRPFTLKES